MTMRGILDVGADRFPRDASRGEWVHGRKEPDEPARLARLVKTIEGEIVPRLVVARRLRMDAAKQQSGSNDLPDEVDVKEMVRLLLAHDTGVAAAYVETLRQRGATLETICLDLLAPAARELGLLWEEDECDFMQVTVGLCRLHQVLRGLSPEFDCANSDRDGGRRILLVPYPGEQHTFGVTLVAQFLRRAGWDVWQEFPENVEQLIQITRETSFAAVGLSVGCETRLDGVGETLRGIRATSLNRSIAVLIGGATCVANPSLAASLGADASATDGRDAVRQVQRVHARGGRRALGLHGR